MGLLTDTAPADKNIKRKVKLEMSTELRQGRCQTTYIRLHREKIQFIVNNPDLHQYLMGFFPGPSPIPSPSSVQIGSLFIYFFHNPTDKQKNTLTKRHRKKKTQPPQ